MKVAVINMANPSLSDSTDIMKAIKQCRSSVDPWIRNAGALMANRIAGITMDASNCRSTSVEWITGTMMVFIGLMLFAADHMPGKSCNTLALGQILNLLTEDDDSEIKTFVKNNPQYNFLLSPILLSTAHTTKEGYKSVFFSLAMSSICSPLFAPILNKDDKDLMHLDEEPTAVFMIVSEGDYSSMTIASTILTIMHMSMISRIESSPEAKAKIPVHFIIDEFGSLNLPFMSDWVAQGRARGLWYLLACQSRGQLVSKYGLGITESIESNCGLRIFMGSNNMEALIYQAYQMTTDKEDPLMTIDQLRKMTHGQAVVMCDGTDPYFGRMLDISTVVELYPLHCDSQPYYDVPIPNVLKWHEGCEESELYEISYGD